MGNPSDRVDMLKRIIASESLLLSIGDVAKAIDVSPRQLRYWEKKGYVKTNVSESGQRKYTYPALIQAGNIAHYLNKGYTLAMAAKKAEDNRKLMKMLRIFLQSRVNKGYEIENGYEIDLGEVKNLPAEEHLLIDVMKDGESYFKIKKTND